MRHRLRRLLCAVGFHGLRPFGVCIRCGNVARYADHYDSFGEWRH